MKLTFRLAFKFASLALVLGVSVLVHYLVRGQQSGTQRSAEGQQQTSEQIGKFCASATVRNGQRCEFAGATYYYDEAGNLANVDCFYVCPGELQVVKSNDTELTLFDNLPIVQQAATLSDNGPLVPASLNMNDISMRAFIKADWHFYVSYSLTGNAAALTITAKDIHQFDGLLEPGDKLGDKLKAVFQIPKQFGSELRVANITINVPLGSEFQLHGIGILGQDSRSKNHASRSPLSAELQEPISNVTVTPKRISTQKEEKMSYWFYSRSPYTYGAAEFFLYKYNPKQGPVPIRVHSTHYDSIKANQKTGTKEWDGKNNNGEFSFGLHRLQIRAWRGQKDGGEWFGPYYSPAVVVSK